MNEQRRKAGGRGVISIRQMAIILQAMVLLFLLAVTAVVYFAGRNIANNYMEDVGSATLNYYESELNYTLQTINDYCQNNVADNDSFAAYDNSPDRSREYELKAEIGETLQSMLQMSQSAYFVMSCPVSPDKSACMYRSRCKTMNERDTLRDSVLSAISSTGPSFAFNRWKWVAVNDTWYLRNIYRFDDTYCAVFLDTSVLSSQADAESNYYILCSQDGKPITGNESLKSAVIIQPGRVRVNEKVYSLRTVPSQQGDFSVCCLVTSAAPALAKNMVAVYIALPLLILGLFLGSSALLRHLFGMFANLNRACTQIASGDISTPISERSHFAEEGQIYDAFNDMMQQIKDLKIAVYEQELASQQSKMQFLRVQIKSHFFVNCLNVIHSLSMIGNNDLIQEFTLCLSDYFRYLGSGFSDTVRFRQELAHLQNYVKIHQMRYPDRISCQFQVSPEVEDMEILPMIPQTIVENIFKHVLGVKSEVQIIVRAEAGRHESQNGMWLTIADDGPGFTEEQLVSLNSDAADTPDIATPIGNGTGIINTKKRLDLYYKGRAEIRFGNTPEGGAVVRIFFPGLSNEEGE